MKILLVFRLEHGLDYCVDESERREIQLRPHRLSDRRFFGTNLMSAFPKKPDDPNRLLWIKFRLSAEQAFNAKLTAAQSGTDWLKWVRNVVVKATKKYGEVKR